ncbi:MAG: peptidoglycan DD-metalloendopeptidase family protein [Clostridia bacterium]|nr:peptidoglycan DD-metalloendopeptidase family protein [Clostridia bacterium]
MRKLISIILVISVCMVTFISYASNEVDNTESNTINQTNEINVLQQQRNEVQNQIQENEEKIDEIEDERTESLKQIATLDEGIQNTQKVLKNLNSDIKNLEEQVNLIQEQLRQSTIKYNEQKDLLDTRLVAMYQSGDIQYLDVLLSSSSISDFISNYYLITELVDYDTILLEEVEQEKNIVEQKEKELTNKQNTLATQKQEQLKTQKVLENNKFLRQTYVEQLSKEEKTIQDEIDKYNKQIQDIENEIRNLATKKSFGAEYKGGTMKWPIDGHYRITSKYGMRTHPITGVYKLHTGIDVSAKTGDEFIAAAYGMVTKAGYNKAYGNMVIIDHGGGVQTLYAHGSSIEVEVGDIVNAGDIVLKVGSTGYSTGPHAHFEIRINGETVNPLDYISIPDKDAN